MDIWSLLRKNKATYADLEKSVFSRKYLNAYENFDYSFDGPVFHPRWNRETFYAGTEKDQTACFFRMFWTVKRRPTTILPVSMKPFYLPKNFLNARVMRFIP